MSMVIGKGIQMEGESPIFQDLSIYKVIETNHGKKVMLHYDGSVSNIIPFSGINNTAMQEFDFEELFKGIRATLDDLPRSSVSVQFLMVRESMEGKAGGKDLPSFLKPRAEYLEFLAENYQLFENKFYLCVHVKGDDQKQEGIFTRIYKEYISKRNDRTYKLERAMGDINNRLAELTDVSDALSNMLREIGANPVVLKKEQDFYDIVQEFTRPKKSKEEKIKIDNEDRIASPRQQLFSGVRANLKKKDFVLDDYYHKVWSLDRVPREVIYGRHIDVIESVPYEFIYSITFRITPDEEALSIFKYKLMEKRIAVGSDESSIVEDRVLIADEKRISDSYDEFAYGVGRGVVMSANFVLRVKESFAEKLMVNLGVSFDELVRRLDQDLTKKVFAKFGGSEWVNEDGIGWFIFCKIMPGMSYLPTGREFTPLKSQFVTTENLPYFLAVYDNKRPGIHHNGTNHFIDYRGNRLDFDLFDESLPAWNYSVSGQTGSGKSVLINALLTMQFSEIVGGKFLSSQELKKMEKSERKKYLSKMPVICILDVGGDRGSYMKFMELVGGTQINLSRRNRPSIQMLELTPEMAKPKESKIKKVAEELLLDHSIGKDLMEEKVRNYYYSKAEMENSKLDNKKEMTEMFYEVFEFMPKDEYFELLKLHAGEVIPDTKQQNLIMGVIEIMLSSNTKDLDGFKIFDSDDVQNLLHKTYEKFDDRFPTLTDFYNTAEEIFDINENKTRKFLVKIGNYLKGKANDMFDKPSSIDMDNNVILADLKGLESEPHLQAIYTLLISQAFNNKMYGIRDRRKIIVRDEAWSLMSNERARRYFVEDLRTARKNGFATIAISQLPTDYLTPSVQDGRAIISSMQVNIFCKFSTNEIVQEVGREYSLPENMVEEMKKLGIQRQTMEDGTSVPSYAKFMMIIGSSIYILKNLLHPFEYILYSSSAADNAIIDFYLKDKDRFPNLEAVLWHIASKKHMGDLELASYLEEAGQMNMARRIRGKR